MLSVTVVVFSAVVFLFISVLVIILCTPVIVRADFDRIDVRLAQLDIRIVGGAMTVFSSAVPPPMNSGREGETDANHPSRKGRDRSTARGNWSGDIETLIRSGPELIIDIIRRLRLETHNLSVSFGLSDPADTGVLYGQLAPVVFVIPFCNLTPDFNGAMLRANGRIAIRFIPITLMPPVLGFFWAVFVIPKMGWAST